MAPQKILTPKSIPKLWRNWRPHKLYETMQNKQAWYFVGQNYYFSGNPQSQAGLGAKFNSRHFLSNVACDSEPAVVIWPMKMAHVSCDVTVRDNPGL